MTANSGGWTVVVNEVRILSTRAGSEWWAAYRYGRRPNAGAWDARFTDLDPTLGGGLVQVACDSKEDAAWLAEAMVERGVPKSAVKVARAGAGRDGKR